MVYIRRFVNVAMTGGKRKVRALADGNAAKLTCPDESEPDDVVAAGKNGSGGSDGRVQWATWLGGRLCVTGISS